MRPVSAYGAALSAFEEADDAWNEELERLFPGQSRAMRIGGRGIGEPGTKLRSLYDGYLVAMKAFTAVQGDMDERYGRLGRSLVFSVR